MKNRIGILAHSGEGAALCFLECIHEGENRLGPHVHPDIVMDIEPMGPVLDAWEMRDYAPIVTVFRRQATRLKDAGAAFWVCPDNTAHIAFEAMTEPLPLPGLHIAEIVAEQAAARGFRQIGITGTRWTMEGPVYPGALARRGLAFVTPPEDDKAAIQAMIFDELVRGKVTDTARRRLSLAVERLKGQGCDAVVLGCTELPMLLNEQNSPLPPLDSTRLLARAAVDVALGSRPLPTWRGGPLR